MCRGTVAEERRTRNKTVHNILYALKMGNKIILYVLGFFKRIDNNGNNNN